MRYRFLSHTVRKMRTASHLSSVAIHGTVTSVNRNSSCCGFVGGVSDDDRKSVRVGQTRRAEDEALANRAAELTTDTVVALAVDRCIVGTTRLVGRQLAVVG